MVQFKARVDARYRGLGEALTLAVAAPEDRMPDPQDLYLRPRLRSRARAIKSSVLNDDFSDSSIPDNRRAHKEQNPGRPVTYKGDPNFKVLTEAERRQIKRRVANRESARRVRAKRFGALQELQIKMEHLTQHKSDLAKRVSEAEEANAAVSRQLQECHTKLRALCLYNNNLQQQAELSLKQLKVFCSTLQKLRVLAVQVDPHPQHTSGQVLVSFRRDSQELLFAGAPYSSAAMSCTMAAEGQRMHFLDCSDAHF